MIRFVKKERAERNSEGTDFSLIPKFQLGEILSPGIVDDTYEHEEIILALARHVCGDWGEIQEEDWGLNERALRTNGETGNLVSWYRTRSGVPITVVTDLVQGVTRIVDPIESFETFGT